MTTAVQLVNRALRILRVTDAGEAVEATDFVTAIEALNAMLARWEANGLALGWSPVSTPDETVPIPLEAEEAVAYNLALRLRGEYGAVLDQDTIAFARDGLETLRRDRLVSSPLVLRRALAGGRFNIVTDDYR